MIRGLIMFLVLAAPLLAQDVTMDVSPSTSVTSGDTYTVTATAPSWFNDAEIDLYRNGNWVGYGYGQVSYSFTDTGNQTITYSADTIDPSSGYDDTGSIDVTISIGSMAPPTSSNSSMTWGVGWTPSISAPSSNGTGTLLYCVAGCTNYESTPWDATNTNAGTYSFYVAQKVDSNHQGNTTDPIQGPLEVNSSPYTIVVNKAPMSPPQPLGSSYTINAGSSWSALDYVDGSSISKNGTGAVMWCVSGQFNYTSSSWTPSQGGTYSFYLAQKVDGNHYGNNTDPIQGPMEVNSTGYTLNVKGPVTFAFQGGPFTYDGNSHGVSLSGISPADATYSESGTWSATSANTYTASVDGTGNFTGHAQYTWTINKANQGTAVTINPNSASVSTGDTLGFSAGGGDGSGAYVWGGDASGAPNGPTASVTFNSASTHYVTVKRAGDGNYNDSSTATATIAVSQRMYTLSTSASPSAAGSVAGGGTYAAGSSAQVEASANSGYAFSSWSGAVSGATNPTSVTMNSDESVTANFVAVSPPAITSPAIASGTVNIPFTYTITASNSPTQFGATGLPSGLSVNISTGVISGTPTAAGSSSVTITASNAGGVGTATLTISVFPPLAIVTQPVSQSVGAGMVVNFVADATGYPAPTYQWQKNGANIPGASGTILTLTNVQTSDSGSTYDVVVTNANGSVTSDTATLSVRSSVPDTTDSASSNQLNVHTPHQP